MSPVTDLKNSDIETGYGLQALQKILDSSMNYKLKLEGVRILKALRDALRIITRAKEELLAVHGARDSAGNIGINTANMETEQRFECLRAFDLLSEEIAVKDFTKWAVPTSPTLQGVLETLSANEVSEVMNLIDITV